MNTMTETDLRDLVDSVLYKPYEVAARGPDSFDCWGLVHYFYKQALNIDLPTFAGLNIARKELPSMISINLKNGHWVKLDKPENLCIVVMGKNFLRNHIGVFLDDFNGVCLHAAEKTGVIGQTIQNLKISNFKTIEFYRWQE